MDLWTDLNSGTEWGLGIFDHQNGLFGDLKEASHIKCDIETSKPRDAVEQVTPLKSEEPIDFEWMESGDLSSFLDALDNGQDKLLSSVDSMLDCSQGLSTNIDRPKTLLVSNDGVDILSHGLTPPDSPEQVTPVIRIDPEVHDNNWTLNAQDLANFDPQNISLSFQEPVPGRIVNEFQNTELLGDGVEFQADLFEVTSFLGLPITVEDAENEEMSSDGVESSSSDDGSSISLTPPNSVSPKPSINSLIQSSPELYKVIATPSDLSIRFSPYKTNGDNKAKVNSKSSKSKQGKQALDLEVIPEEFITNRLGKKERKKMQNKNAAIRYRQKKKVEVELIANEVQGLETRNSELKTKVDDLQREVKYMKSLMEDIYRAKGLVL